MDNRKHSGFQYLPYSGGDFDYKERSIRLPHHVLRNSLQRIYEIAVDQLKVPSIVTPESFMGAAIASAISAIIAMSDAGVLSWPIAQPHVIVCVTCLFVAVVLHFLKVLDIAKIGSNHKRRDRAIDSEIHRLYEQASPTNATHKR